MTALLCFVSGSLCALTMAPYNIWAVFLIGFGVLYWAIDRAPRKRVAFAYGWVWAFGYFVFSLYWIGNALLVEGNPYKWAWPLAVCGLPALLAFFNGFASLIVKWVCDLKRWHGYFGFAAVLSLFEYARGHVFTGFPWNLYGYSWIDLPQIAQIAAFESIYFLSFLTLLWLSAGGFLIVSNHKKQKIIMPVGLIVLFIACLLYGGSIIPQRTEFRDDVAIKLVQPNTNQAEKWQRDKMEGHFFNALELSEARSQDGDTNTLILWPETVLSPAFLNDPYYREQIGGMLQRYQGEAVLMTGALRREGEDYYNSLLTINAQGSLGNIYNKSHLVPFGEYIPFQKYIPLAPVAQFSGFVQGDGVTSLSLFGDLTYSPLICYEILFPHKAVAKDTHPDFIVNVTNDAWYGDSAGPRQHLVKARFRAIEERVPVLRAANTGISAIIDPYGGNIATTDIFAQDILSYRLPAKPLNSIGLGFYSFLLFPFIPIALFILALSNAYMRK